MSKPVWWTCGCGRRNCSRGAGSPVCEGCGKPAKFTVLAPQGQGGFDFGGDDDCEPSPRRTGYEED
jgi:hypothetical protein